MSAPEAGSWKDQNQLHLKEVIQMLHNACKKNSKQMFCIPVTPAVFLTLFNHFCVSYWHSTSSTGLKKTKLKSNLCTTEDEEWVRHFSSPWKSEGHSQMMTIPSTFEGYFLFSGSLRSHVLLSCLSSSHYVPGIQMTLTGAVKLLIAEGLCFYQSCCTQMN